MEQVSIFQDVLQSEWFRMVGVRSPALMLSLPLDSFWKRKPVSLSSKGNVLMEIDSIFSPFSTEPCFLEEDSYIYTIDVYQIYDI